MGKAVNQKTVADAVAQKLQSERQQIVRKISTADVEQNFLIPFVDLTVNAVEPVVQLIETDVLSGCGVVRLLLKVAL